MVDLIFFEAQKYLFFPIKQIFTKLLTYRVWKTQQVSRFYSILSTV